MLEVARVCPRCGNHLPEEAKAASWHLAGNGCHPMVYPALLPPEARVPEDDPPVPAGRQIQDFEAPTPHSRRRTAFSALEVVPPFENVSRGLAAPWLRPPDLGEVL